MSDKDNEELDSINELEEETDSEETDKKEDSDEDSKSKKSDSEEETDDVEKLKEQNKRLFERAKKAEGFVKDEDGSWIKKEKPKSKPQSKEDKGDLTAKDAILLMREGVDHDEDIDEVARFAKFQKIGIGDALKSKTIKAILAERKEERKTADATHTGPAKKGSSKATDEDIIKNAEQGKFPEDPMELILAREKQRGK